MVSEPGRRETIFVVDALRELDALSGKERKVTRWAPGLSPVLPLTVAWDDGNLVLPSLSGGVFQVWDPEAQEVIEEHAFAAPTNAIRFQDDLIVAESASASVVRIPANDPSAREVLIDGLALPAGLAASQNDLWVGDRGTGRVWKIIGDGASLASPALVADNLEGPEGLALHRSGDLLVVEAEAGRISRIDLDTGETFAVAEDLAIGAEGPSGLPASWYFKGMAIGRGGWIYATSDVEDSIYRLRPLAGR